MPVKPTQPGDGSVRERAHDGGRRERERITDIQRTRMLAAVAQACAERGAANITVAHVVARAGVSRRTFYEIFDDIEGCFLAAFDDVVARASERVRPAYDMALPWRERIRAALIALLEFLEAEPFMGRLAIVEVPGVGWAALRRRQDVLAHLVAAMEEGRHESKAASEPPALTGEGVVGAVFSIVHGHMLESRAEPLVELVNPLMSIVVLPYLGSAAARRELDRPVAKSVNEPRPPDPNPLRALDIRLTYRTVCVLAAVAEHSGASNKGIADAAGIADQGQISKLLARLERLGLVENLGPGPMRGEPNAWTLTQAGRDVHASVASAA